MAEVKFIRGSTTSIDRKNIKDGQILIDKDTGKMYVDILTDTNQLERKNISKTQVQIITWEEEEEEEDEI